ncbi:hypothetical protein Psi02_76350 [Planotetraspora silvatica]|uniref:UGSC-like domain-containing protein n=1 Tax=Planotetraspora silvatica TaxID=234614 RepID=A0A8J3UXD7_9ACTN|nr:UGSC family (seleno)protein [Planotetraspora silvatica]GII51211.1 hypothetical protein Psi02_76350 [Planotetraspora silvatica]
MMTSDSVRIYDPRGVVEVEQSPLAPRAREMVRLRLGVLSNTKWNAAKLLRATVRALEAGGTRFESVNFYDKEHFSSDASPEVIAAIAAENDVALIAIGDCGSCTSSCVNDGVRLEQAGTPAAVIVTTEFEHEARLQREARGMAGLEMAGLEMVVVAHPISSLTLEQLDDRAAEAAPQACDIWFPAGHTERPADNATHSVV